jgi:tripartite motif-containing protein 2/3/tripartite motif-containing protein 71
MCTTIHGEWDAFSKHEVVALEQLESKMKQVHTLKKVTLYCSLHESKELELYCETCEELICHNCTVKKHKDHQYDLVVDTFDAHKAEITESAKPIESQFNVVCMSLEEIDMRSKELKDHQATSKNMVQIQAQALRDLIEKREAELYNQIDQQTEMKLKNLTAQKDEVETVQVQLQSCLSFVKESLRTGSKGEVMKVKKTIMRQVKEMKENFNPDMLPPCELANVKFISSPHPAPAFQQFGTLYLQRVSPKTCYALGKGLKEAEPSQTASVVLHTVDSKGKAVTTPIATLTCELVSKITDEKIDCSVKQVQASQYEISYQVTNGGRYQLSIMVEDEHIKGSPFAIKVRNLNKPMSIIGDVRQPSCIAINKVGNVIVAEDGRRCVSVFSAKGEKLQSFGSEQSLIPHGVAVDDSGCILVVDTSQHRILKFMSDGKLISTVGKCGISQLEFSVPIGAVIHPHNKRLYVADQFNHRIQVLNPEFTCHNTFGSQGSENGKFSNPTDVAFDSIGNVYVADLSNCRIQVFTADGEFLRKFGKEGEGKGELRGPSRIEVSKENMVYVAERDNHRISIFTLEGTFLTSFGTEGSQPGQFNMPRGIAVDKNGVIYVCDNGNNRLQLFL